MSQERRNYRKVYTRIWKSPEFRGLSDALKVATLYVLTGPQTNRVGLYYFSFAQAAEALGSTSPKVRSMIGVVCKTFAWTFDQKSSVIWIPTWWSFNPVSQNPKNLQGYLSDLNDVPRTELIHSFCNNLRDIPAIHHHMFERWKERLAPASVTDHRSIGDRSTSTETCTSTETETVAPKDHGATQPVRPAIEHYHVRFVAKYRGKPEYSGVKDGARMKRLLKANGLEDVKRRIEAFFDSPDPWIQNSGHTLDVFFSSGVQTKLVAALGARPAGTNLDCPHDPQCDAPGRWACRQKDAMAAIRKGA